MSHRSNKKTKVGLALGSGAARGWSHIGVINALEKLGIEPDIIAGTSIGSLVGAAYADDRLEALEKWVRALKWHDVVGYFDISLDGGFIAGKKLFHFLRENFYEKDITDLAKPFGAVATDMESGVEIWLREGSVMDAARASSSMPGFFTPVKHNGTWLLDGGLVNPIPVSLCRAMGANIVIAVDLNATLMWREEDYGWQNPIEAMEKPQEERDENGEFIDKMKKFKDFIWPDALGKTLMEDRDEVPSIIEVLSRSLNIMQLRISRSRMAGDPPDIVVTPRLTNINMLDFHRASESIVAGEEAVSRIENQLKFYNLI
ncbi:MAG: patatin-like phospholipase RssA [Gammaproteobacteria bacterium]|nr:patatin-like phospholipase RssA [Gammaproteobacteria bacterium]